MNERITLDYGSGGLKTAELIDNILLPAFDNPALSSLGDGALLAGNRQLRGHSLEVSRRRHRKALRLRHRQ